MKKELIAKYKLPDDLKDVQLDVFRLDFVEMLRRVEPETSVQWGSKQVERSPISNPIVSFC